jgi:hypothetical protein
MEFKTIEVQKPMKFKTNGSSKTIEGRTVDKTSLLFLNSNSKTNSSKKFTKLCANLKQFSLEKAQRTGRLFPIVCLIN